MGGNPVASSCVSAFLAESLVLGVAPDTAADAIPLPDTRETWIETRSANFTIYANTGARSARKAVEQLERLRYTIALLTSVDHVNSPMPTTVFLFRNGNSFEPYASARDGQSMAGYFSSHTDGNLIALNAEHATQSIIQHEYLRFLNSNNLPGLPVWCNEGLAEYFSTFSSDSKEATVGKPIGHHIVRLGSHDLMPVERLFAVTHSSPEYNESTKQGLFYAKAWCLMHYLYQISKKDRLYTPAKAFLSAVIGGTPSPEAYREAFGTDNYDVLNGALRSYLKRTMLTYAILEVGEWNIDLEVSERTLRRDETLARLGMLLAHQTARAADAETHLRGALEVNGECDLAFVGLGYLSMREDDWKSAIAHLERAVTLEPRRAMSSYYLGACLLDSRFEAAGTEDPEDPAVQEIVKRARGAFVRAVNLDAQLSEAYAALGLTFVHGPDSNPRMGIIALQTAHRRFPSRDDIMQHLLTLYTREGDSTSVRALVDDFYAKGRRGPSAERHFIATASRESEDLVDDGEFEAAIEFLDRFGPLMDDIDRGEDASRMRAYVATRWQYELLMQAENQIRMQHFEEGIRLLEQAVEIDAVPRQTATAREVLATVREHLEQSTK